MPIDRSRRTTCGDRSLVAKTCLKCNQLKMASEFRRRPESEKNHGFYDSHCLDCSYKRSNQSNKQANDKSLEKAKHYRDNWTQDELTLLERLSNQGLSNRDIAERLGRTISAIHNRIRRLRDAEMLEEFGVRLCYFNPRTGVVRQVGRTFAIHRKGREAWLNKAAQELSGLHKQLIFFVDIEGGGEYMGIRGLDALKQGDDREPEDTSPDVENETPADE